ncbi:hypothetical protein EMCRGX_G004941 [Ephydatia muelleri]
MRTVLQLRLFIALLCAASCCYGLPWVDSEDADTPVDMDENAPGDETEAEWEDEVLYAVRYCSATARVTGKDRDRRCTAAVGDELTAKAEIPETRARGICSSIQRAVIEKLRKKYPGDQTGCNIQAVGSCDGC